MLRIMLPCWPVDEQLQARTQLLREMVGFRFPIGLEIGMSMGLFLQDAFLQLAQKELADMQFDSDFSLSFHGPQAIARGEDLSANFFMPGQGMDNFIRAVEFARSFNAQLINVHAQHAVDYSTMEEAASANITGMRKHALNNTAFVLRRLQVRKHTRPDLCVENVPHNLRADQELSPERGLFEVAFVDLRDFRTLIDPQRRVFATIDTCHLAQAYDSSELLEQIQQLPPEAIREVHFADIGKSWQPFISLAEEGVIPGQGRIGTLVMQELLSYFVQLSKQQDINLVLEIDDKEDYAEAKQSRRALAIVLAWLKELGA